MTAARGPALPLARGLAPFALVVAALLLVESPYLLDLATIVAIHALPAVGLALLLGHAGQISLGHAAFYGMGAYGSALLSLRLGLDPWLATPLAVAATGLVAYLLGRPILRLRGHYLAMATLGFGSIVSILLVEWRGLTGGAVGLRGIPGYDLAGFSLAESAHAAPFAWGVLALACLLLFNLTASPAGLLLRGLGDSERAVASLGAETARLKGQVFALSAMLAATGGALYAHTIGFLSPQPFGIGFSVRLLVVVAIGGFRSPVGVIAAVAFATAIAEPLQDLGHYDVVVFGALLVVVVVLCPDGLLAPALARLRRPGGAAS